METALGILIALNVAMLTGLLYHLSQCAQFHERLAAIEQWKKTLEGK